MDKVIIYNPRNGSEINERYAQAKWKHEVNTIYAYDEQMAQYLLKKYGFLEEVQPKDIADVKKRIEAKYACTFKNCNYVTDSQERLDGHIAAKHKVTKEIQQEVDGIPTAQPVTGQAVAPRTKSIEEQEGIPDTSKGDKDNWYGGGLEADVVDSGMMQKKVRGVTPGQF